MGHPAAKLYDEVMKLPPAERRAFALRVLASVSEGTQEGAQPSSGPTASWETIESLRGIVSVGGNALEDCNRLYDG